MKKGKVRFYRGLFSSIQKDRNEGNMRTLIKITPEQLTAILTMFDTDMTEWGKPGRRNAGDLLATIQRREGSLIINADGISFGLQTARALIRNAGNVLICGWKNLRGKDNSNLEVAGLPGGKLAENEDSRLALGRELLEELDLHTADYSVTGYESVKGASVIRALPGLTAKRTDHIFSITLQSDHQYLTLKSFEREEHGHVALFKWIPETEWNERRAKI